MTLIPLEIWHGWTEEDGALLEAVLRDYQRLHPRVWIQIRRVSSVSLKEAFRRASLNGRPPTLLLAPAHWIPDLADEGLLLPLDGLTGRADVERLYPSTLDAVRYQGVLYGYPLGFHTVALYGNRRYVQEMPQTWTGVLTVAASVPPTVAVGLAWPLTPATTLPYLATLGGRLPGEENTNFLDRTNLDWLAWVRDQGARPGVRLQTDYGQLDTLFKEGQVALMVGYTWSASEYRRALGDPFFQVAPLPRYRDQIPRPLVFVQTFLLSPLSTQEQREEAIQLLRFLTSQEVQSLLSRSTGLLPAHAGVHPPLLTPVVRQASRGWPVTGRVAATWDPVQKMLRRVVESGVDPGQAALEAQQILRRP